MSQPVCYVVKSSHANYWFNVERGVWVARSDVTRFLEPVSEARQVLEVRSITRRARNR